MAGARAETRTSGWPATLSALYRPAEHDLGNNRKICRWILCFLLVGSLGLQLYFCATTPMPDLLDGWFPDDAFYYLQPAWLHHKTGFFTFDGSHETYGFQPLWMLLLAALAPFTPDKESFLRGAMMLGAVLFCGAALLLWLWLRRVVGEARALFAPTLLLLNPSMLHMNTAGTETAIQLCLLIAALGPGLDGMLSGGSTRRALLFGTGCGLLLLARVDTLPLVLLLLLTSSLRAPTWHDRARRLVLVGAGLAAVLTPWILYAWRNFGAVLPVSGSRKLIGAGATLVYTVRNHFPALPAGWLERLLPPIDQTLLAHPAALESFAPGYFLDYLIKAPIGWAMGAWLPIHLLEPAERTLRDWLLLPCLLILPVLAAVALSHRRIHLITQPGLGLLALWAIINPIMHGLLLSPYIHFAFWYRVPETLALLVAAALVAALASDVFSPRHQGTPLRNSGQQPCLTLAVDAMTRRTPLGKAPSGRALSALAKALVVFSLAVPILLNARAFALFATGRWRPAVSDFAREARFASEWLNDNLPAGERVGSWNAGLLGYQADGPIVVNLDGLANSRDFVQSVVVPDVLYRAGASGDNVMWHYLRQEGIHWIADAALEGNLEQAPLFQVFPLGCYEVVYRGGVMPGWIDQEGLRRFVVVRLVLGCG